MQETKTMNLQRLQGAYLSRYMLKAVVAANLTYNKQKHLFVDILQNRCS